MMDKAKVTNFLYNINIFNIFWTLANLTINKFRIYRIKKQLEKHEPNDRKILKEKLLIELLIKSYGLTKEEGKIASGLKIKLSNGNFIEASEAIKMYSDAKQQINKEGK